MQNLRLLMEDLTDAVATVFADHGEPILLGMFLDDFTDVPESCARANQLDAFIEAFLSDLAEAIEVQIDLGKPL